MARKPTGRTGRGKDDTPAADGEAEGSNVVSIDAAFDFAMEEKSHAIPDMIMAFRGILEGLKKPWEKTSQDDQEAILRRVEGMCQVGARKLLKLAITGPDRVIIEGILKKISGAEADKPWQLTISVSASAENVETLFGRRGLPLQLITASIEDLNKPRDGVDHMAGTPDQMDLEDPPADPDQPNLH